MKHYVGNLPYGATEEDVRAALAAFNPSAVDMVHDNFTGRFRGYAFVECESEPKGELKLGIRNLHIGFAR